MLGIALLVGEARVEISRLFYAIDPETGAVVDVVPQDQRSTAVGSSYVELSDRIWALVCVGWVSLVLTWWGLRRREHGTGLRWRRISAPLLLPIGALLSAATLLNYRFDGDLEMLLDSFTRDGAVLVGMCMRHLSGCSHLQGYELLRTAALWVSAISVALLIPAAREAWRAGVQGRRLSRFGCVAALVCFCVGSVAFVSTRTSREDHLHTVIWCNGKAWPHPEDRVYIPIATSTKLQMARVHALRPFEEFGAPSWYWAAWGEAYEIFADGEISNDLSNADFQAELKDLVRNHDESYRDEFPDGPVMGLHVDERVPLARMRELLEIAKAAGVRTVVVFGEARLTRDLPSMGSWERRVHAPHAKLLLRDGERSFDDFTTWKQLSDEAASRGPDGLSVF